MRMLTEIIQLRSGKKSHLHASRRGGEFWYAYPGSARYNQEKMRQVLREGIELEFHGGRPECEFLGLLSAEEKGSISNEPIDRNRQGDKALLYRIIRAGGFCNYIEHLEGYLSAMDEAPIKKEDLTCFNCTENKTCKYAWDEYNTQGDCLASK